MVHSVRIMKRLLQSCTLLLLAGSTAHLHAQALQFVPAITTYAGTGTSGYSGDNGQAALALLSSPHISDTDAAGNLYITDTTNSVVRRVDAVTGIITTFAGTGTAGYSGDNGLATAAKLNQPKGLRVDAFGNVVIADLNNNRIRSVNPSTGIITTIVGSATQGTGITANGTLANAVKFDSPFDLAFDKNGNLYVSDYYDNQIVLITAVNGAIVPTSSKAYCLAGNGTSGRIGDGGPAINAEVYNPRGITVDINGNIFLADFSGNLVRRITSPFQAGVMNLSSAIISTYAGNGVSGSTGDGGLATNAAVAAPQGVAVDAAGNLYIAQYGTGLDYIRVVNPASQIINTFAGIGTAGYSGDKGAAITAKLYSPAGLNFDPNGRVFIADSTNNRMRLIQSYPIFGATAVGSSSVASNVVARASQAVTPAALSVTSNSYDFSLSAMTGCTLNTAAAAGAFCTVPVTFAPTAPGIRSTAITLTDASANAYVTGVIGVGTAPAIAYTPATISTLAGTGVAGNTGNGGPASLAQISAPRGSVIDASGSIVFADSGSNAVRRIDHSTGAISILAGVGTRGYSGDGGAATAAKLNAPAGVALDPSGNLYIADTGNNCIRFVNAATGIISTIAGTTTAGYTGDLGLATVATLNAPTALALDFGGRLYVADTGNHVIRRFYPNGGYIATIAGIGTAGYTGDGAQAALAALNTPTAVALDSTGVLYIADQGNNVIRKVTLQGIISTYAGTQGVTANAGDGGPATSASLQTPSDVALDAAGDLYIAAGNQVRFVSAAGTISTVAGNGISGSYSGESGAATHATIPGPAMNLAVDGLANIYIADTAGNLELMVAAGTPPTLNFGTQASATSGTPQTIAIVNTGNQTLTLSGLSASANFTLQSTASTACSATSALSPGASCTLTIVFSPGSVGNFTGSVVLTDNALNGSAPTQSIPLIGVGAVPANPTTTTVTANPTAPTYGSPVILTATVTGTALTGSVIFSVDGIVVGTVAVSSGKGALTLPKLAAGKRTITATYTNDAVNATSTGTLSLSVQSAVLTVTASNVSRTFGLANPAFTYTISGYFGGDTSSVVSGSATFTSAATTSSPVGQYPITYSASTLSAANYTFVYVGATLTVTATDFVLTAAPTTITMPTGQTASVTVTVTPVGPYQGTVALSCGALPANVTCTFTTTTLTADGSGQAVQSQLVIATDNFNHLGEAISPPKPGRSARHLLPLSFAMLPFIVLLGARTRRMGFRVLLALALLLSVGSITACANATKTNAATGTSSITLTGADASGLSHNVVLTLTLQ